MPEGNVAKLASPADGQGDTTDGRHQLIAAAFAVAETLEGISPHALVAVGTIWLAKHACAPGAGHGRCLDRWKLHDIRVLIGSNGSSLVKDRKKTTPIVLAKTMFDRDLKAIKLINNITVTMNKKKWKKRRRKEERETIAEKEADRKKEVERKAQSSKFKSCSHWLK
ncbi:hypothetical protein PoB_002001600 [Plakobranchus ocellatus]|uniref:Uncharacterized protein n=1 Tax=Plakobranchus ocellatus TaxID=259542 RepID=A0AAV3ZC76_9GAST|nr:hypothetical protein PoB_002001600 [Plakobranchus ocellatus]